MALKNSWCGTRLCKLKGSHRWMLAICITVVFLLFCHASIAAEKLPKYQLIPGNDDKAFLLDTSTGYVWVLTYRTLATGREPIAIPYKFIKISPKSKNDFIVEDTRNNSIPLDGNP